MTTPTTTTLLREDHCTHPTQAWCDCDWCRLVRASQAKSESVSILVQASVRLSRNVNLSQELIREDGLLVIDRLAGYPHAERTEQEIWASLTPELCDRLEAVRLGGGTIGLREAKP